MTAIGNRKSALTRVTRVEFMNYGIVSLSIITFEHCGGVPI